MMPGVHRHRLSDGLVLWADATDEAVSLPILDNRYELNELDFLRRTVKPGDRVIDLGAHIGGYTLRLAALVGPNGRVTAVEPSAAHAEALRRSIAENAFDDRAEVVHAAAADVSGQGRLHHRTSGSSAHARLTFASGGLAGDDEIDDETVERVAMIRVDELALVGPIAFIKIDVEGSEGPALRGARGLLERNHPTVVVELHPSLAPHAGDDSPPGVIAWMAGLGYECRLMGAGVAGTCIDDVPSNMVTSVVFLPR